MNRYADSHVEFIHHPDDEADLPNPSYTHGQITPAMINAVAPQLLFLACYVEAGAGAWERLLWVIDAYLRVITTNNWNLLRSAAGYNPKQINIILHVENAVAIRDDAADVKVLHERGVRSIGLTHNYKNQYAGGSLTEAEGLTERGIHMIERVIEQGWILDAAHLSTASVRDVYRLWPNRPLFISHCGIRSVFSNPRNVPNIVLKAVRSSDGYVGLGCAGSFLSNKQPTVNDYLRQIDYAVEKVGASRVGIGSDFGGIISALPDKLKSIADLQKIIDRLPDKSIKGDNLIRFVTSKTLKPK